MLAVKISQETKLGSGLHGSWMPFAVAGGAMLTLGGLVAAVVSVSPFAHGAWLAAYLVLVGGVAQVMLGLGQASLAAATAAPRTVRRQLALWNAGSAGVPAGVMLGVPAALVVGSVALLVALALFARGVPSAQRPSKALILAYSVLLAALTVSVFVGCALAFTGAG